MAETPITPKYTSPWQGAINNAPGKGQTTATGNGTGVGISSLSSLTKLKFGGRIDAKFTWVGGPPLSDWSDGECHHDL